MLSSIRALGWALVAFGLLPLSSRLQAGDLSTYRSFRIGANLATVAVQAHLDPTKAQLLYARPALIQQLTWWPDSFGASSRTEAVKVAVLSFYNGELFRIFVVYDRTRTQGLSADDFIDSISALYGFNDEEKVIARWQDVQASVNLIHSSYDQLYGSRSGIKACGTTRARSDDRGGTS